ncbi:MAG TPA: hypothetical protein VGS07_05210 [Thermoanaerobaculia bacterium]|nr:hypothetical protein [Thermoanaerobaculia bacterium]
MAVAIGESHSQTLETRPCEQCGVGKTPTGQAQRELHLDLLTKGGLCTGKKLHGLAVDPTRKHPLKKRPASREISFKFQGKCIAVAGKAGIGMIGESAYRAGEWKSQLLSEQ